MIDFNDAPEQIMPGEAREQSPRHDTAAINAALSRNLSWVEQCFPNGRISRDRKTWCMADWTGRAPTKEGSCKISLAGPDAGKGFDFSTNEGEDPIGAIGRATGLRGRELLDEAARLAGTAPAASPAKRPAPKKRDTAQDIANILAGAEPLAGTLGEHYLSTRKLAAPDSADLLFHPDLTDFDAKRGYCGMVAIVRNAAGEQIGIHRTFLLDDGSGKAPPGKKMLGHIKGGAVRLAAIDAGHIGIAEGIETALAVEAIFDESCWAALSAGNMIDWEWPAETRSVKIFADAGEAGMNAAQALAARLAAHSIPCAIWAPLYGDDFNDDLRRGAAAEEYAPQRLPEAPAAAVALPDMLSYAQLEAFANTITKPVDPLLVGQVMAATVRAQLEPLAERHVLGLVKQNSGFDLKTLEKQVAHVRRQFGSAGSDAVAERPAWAAQLRRDIIGQPERNEANVITALSNDEAFAGAIGFNEFRQEVLLLKPLPWDRPGERFPRAWRDADDVRCAEWLQRRDMNISPAMVSRSLLAVAREMSFHPVRQYLESLKWDGVERLQRWPADYLGAADTALNATFGALWMISAVARVMKPGCKADHMLILEGPQGMKKSSALKALTGAEWFTDELAEIGSKDAAQQLRGVWVIEIAELDAIGRAEVSRIKAFLSRAVDRYRPPYERYPVEVPRECVFAGSINPETYLRDDSGNRRFWPIRCGTIDLKGLERARDQLWAEAFARFKAGAIWWIDDPKLIGEAERAQEERRSRHPWHDLIEDVLGEAAGKIPAEAIWKIVDRPKGQRSQAENFLIGSIMRDLGWGRRVVKIGNRPKKGYVRGNPPFSEIEILKEGDSHVAIMKGFEFGDDEPI